MSERGGQPPRVTVVTPFYNTADYLAECIESVLAQTFVDFEYLLIDNCSTDGSREIAESYALQDERIRFVAFDEHLPQLGMGIDALTRRVLTERYGDRFLEPDELARQRRLSERRHYRVLGEGVLRGHPAALWDLHRHEVEAVGPEIGRAKLALWTAAVAGRMLLHPEWWFRPTWPWHR